MTAGTPRTRRKTWRGFALALAACQPETKPAQESAAWERHRRSIGMTNRFAALFRDLGRMLPRGDLTSTGYALADAGSEYLVYKPDGVGAFTVTLPAALPGIAAGHSFAMHPGLAPIVPRILASCAYRFSPCH